MIGRINNELMPHFIALINLYNIKYIRFYFIFFSRINFQETVVLELKAN